MNAKTDMRELLLLNREKHVLITGLNDAEIKGRIFNHLLLDDARRNCSSVIVDTSPVEKEDEQLDIESAISLWKSEGKKLLVVDPWSRVSAPWAGTAQSVSFNPLLNLDNDPSNLDTRDIIAQIVDAIYSTTVDLDSVPDLDTMYFINQERVLLKNLIYVSLSRKDRLKNLPAIHMLASGQVSKCISYIKSAVPMINDKSTQQFEEDGIFWFISDDNTHTRRRAELLTSLARRTSVFSHPSVKDCMLTNGLDFEGFFKEPTLLILKSPKNMPGANIISSMIIRLLMLKSFIRLELDLDEKSKVFFYLDELPSLRIPALPQFAAIAQKMGVGIVAMTSKERDAGLEACMYARISMCSSWNDDCRVILGNNPVFFTKAPFGLISFDELKFIDFGPDANISIKPFNAKNVSEDIPFDMDLLVGKDDDKQD